MEMVVVGAGFVGIATALAACLSGHTVSLVDTDEKRVEQLRAGELPFFEPGMGPALSQSLAGGSLLVSMPDTLPEDVEPELVVVCVGTPTANGAELRERYVVASQDQRALRTAVRWAADRFGGHVVVKSTVAPGTCARLEVDLRGAGGQVPGRAVHVHHVPEFLAEGAALRGAMRPHKVVLGLSPSSEHVPDAMWEAFVIDVNAHTSGRPGHVVVTDPTTAELVKYANNLALATRVSMINDLAGVAARAGADIGVVAKAIGADERIGRAFLRDGLGWGGSCFGKDLKVLRYLGSEMANAAIEANRDALGGWVRAVEKSVASRSPWGLPLWIDGERVRVAVLGQAFKPGTSDTRDSPAVAFAGRLHALGFEVVSHDPVADLGVEDVPWRHIQGPNAEGGGGALRAVHGAHVAVVATEWDEYVSTGPAALVDAMRGPRPAVVDARHVYRGRAAEFEACGLRLIERPAFSR